MFLYIYDSFFFCSVLSLQGHFQSTQPWKLKTVSLSNQDNKDNAFLLGKDWIGLLEAPYKIKGFPSSGFRVQGSLAVTQTYYVHSTHLGCFSSLPGNREKKTRMLQKPILPAVLRIAAFGLWPSGLCLLPASRKWQDNLLSCKWVNLMPVPDSRMGNHSSHQWGQKLLSRIGLEVLKIILE